jgi:hypothetical protein
MTKLVLDGDGVLLNFSKKYLDLARIVLKKEISPDLSKYNLQEYLKINAEENKIVWDEFNNRDCWSSIEPLPGVKQAIEKLNTIGLDIFIVTSMNPIYKKSRSKNLKDIGLIPKEIFCTGEGHGHKNEIISEIRPFAFVDDRLDHLFRSRDVPHLAWVNNNQKQEIEGFNEISAEVSSLSEWVDNHLVELIKNKNRLKYR